MNKLIIFVGLALFVAATSAQQENSNTTCPTTRPCCTCACPPKGCPPPQRPEYCKRFQCKFVCPHKCEHDVEHQNITQAVVASELVCPTTRPCCSCACTPKGCPAPQKPKGCERRSCLIKCPHICDEDKEQQQEVLQEVAAAPLMDLPRPVCPPRIASCCSCGNCGPKGCPPALPPPHCRFIKCFVCDPCIE